LLKQNRLFIFDDDQNEWLINEFRSYSRELDDNGKPTEKIKDKNTYHGIDSCRYILSSIEGGYGDYSIPIEPQIRRVATYGNSGKWSTLIQSLPAPRLPRY
jgi:hypothetical protein